MESLLLSLHVGAITQFEMYLFFAYWKISLRSRAHSKNEGFQPLIFDTSTQDRDQNDDNITYVLVDGL